MNEHEVLGNSGRRSLGSVRRSTSDRVGRARTPTARGARALGLLIAAAVTGLVPRAGLAQDTAPAAGPSMIDGYSYQGATGTFIQGTVYTLSVGGTTLYWCASTPSQGSDGSYSYSADCSGEWAPSANSQIDLYTTDGYYQSSYAPPSDNQWTAVAWLGGADNNPSGEFAVADSSGGLYIMQPSFDEEGSVEEIWVRGERYEIPPSAYCKTITSLAVDPSGEYLWVLCATALADADDDLLIEYSTSSDSAFYFMGGVQLLSYEIEKVSTTLCGYTDDSSSTTCGAPQSGGSYTSAITLGTAAPHQGIFTCPTVAGGPSDGCDNWIFPSDADRYSGEMDGEPFWEYPLNTTAMYWNASAKKDFDTLVPRLKAYPAAYPGLLGSAFGEGGVFVSNLIGALAKYDNGFIKGHYPVNGGLLCSASSTGPSCRVAFNVGLNEGFGDGTALKFGVITASEYAQVLDPESGDVVPAFYASFVKGNKMSGAWGDSSTYEIYSCGLSSSGTYPRPSALPDVDDFGHFCPESALETSYPGTTDDFPFVEDIAYVPAPDCSACDDGCAQCSDGGYPLGQVLMTTYDSSDSSSLFASDPYTQSEFKPVGSSLSGGSSNGMSTFDPNGVVLLHQGNQGVLAFSPFENSVDPATQVLIPAIETSGSETVTPVVEWLAYALEAVYYGIKIASGGPEPPPMEGLRIQPRRAGTRSIPRGIPQTRR